MNTQRFATSWLANRTRTRTGRGLLEELLAAKQVYAEDGVSEYVHHRVFFYPDWKIRDKGDIEERLYGLLSADCPLRGKLIEVITEARM